MKHVYLLFLLNIISLSVFGQTHGNKHLGNPVTTSRVAGESGSLHIGYADSSESAWKQMASMDVAISSSQSCAMDSLIYVLGGSQHEQNTLNSTLVYNTVTNEWSQRSNIPVDLGWTNAGVINNKIYLTGGWRYVFNPFTIDSTFEYDPVLDTWTAKNACPKKSGWNASCVLNNKLYVFGGYKDFPNINETGQQDALVYDPAADSWDSIPEMINRRGGATAHAYGGQIYIFGGEGYSDKVTRTINKPEKLDPVNNSWEELEDMPVPVIGHSGIVHNNRIYILGGARSNSASAINSIQEYDPLTNKWRLMESMPFRRSVMTAQKVHNYIYIFGGYTKDATNEVWRFDLDSLQEGCKELQIEELIEDLIIGDSVLLHVNVEPSDFANKTSIWTSDNEAVATVSEQGYVKGVREGSATITAQLKYGGCSDSCTIAVVISGIKETRKEFLSVYPNPSDKRMTIKTSLQGNYTLEIASVNGRVLYSKEIEGTLHQIDLSSYKDGVYFVSVRSKNFVATRKVVKY